MITKQTSEEGSPAKKKQHQQIRVIGKSAVQDDGLVYREDPK